MLGLPVHLSLNYYSSFLLPSMYSTYIIYMYIGGFRLTDIILRYSEFSFFNFACCFWHLHQLVILKLLEHFLEGDSKHGCMNMWSCAPNITVNTIQVKLAITISIAVASDSNRVKGVLPAIDPSSSFFQACRTFLFVSGQEYYNITSWYWQGSF